MTDKYISVKATIEAVCGGCNEDFENEHCEPSACSIRERLNAIPAADVVSKADYDELLKAAKAMHTWIFLNSFDELEAYDECKLTPEMNALLGYAGSFEIRSKGDG